MIFEDGVMKRMKVRYGAELFAMREYIILAERSNLPESDVFLKEAERRLFIVDYLHRLLVSAHADLSDFNGQYIDAVRKLDVCKKKVRG